MHQNPNCNRFKLKFWCAKIDSNLTFFTGLGIRHSDFESKTIQKSAVSPLTERTSISFRFVSIVAKRFSIGIANRNESFRGTNNWRRSWRKKFFFSKRNWTNCTKSSEGKKRTSPRWVSLVERREKDIVLAGVLGGGRLSRRREIDQRNGSGLGTTTRGCSSRCQSSQSSVWERTRCSSHVEQEWLRWNSNVSSTTSARSRGDEHHLHHVPSKTWVTSSSSLRPPPPISFRWSEAKILMVKENFFDDLVFFEKDRITDEVFDMLTKIVQFETFHPSFVVTSSKAAAGLCGWVLAIYEYAKIARSQRTKLEQVKTYQELYNKVTLATSDRDRRMRVEHFLATTYSRRETSASGEIEGRIVGSDQRTSLAISGVSRQSETTESFPLDHRQDSIDVEIDRWRYSILPARLPSVSTGWTNRSLWFHAHFLVLLLSLSILLRSTRTIPQRLAKESLLDQPCRSTSVESSRISSQRTRCVTPQNPTSSAFFFFPLELNDCLLKQDSTSFSDKNSILNAITLVNQLENTYVLFVHNPEEETTVWKDFLIRSTWISVDKANQGKWPTVGRTLGECGWALGDFGRVWVSFGWVWVSFGWALGEFGWALGELRVSLGELWVSFGWVWFSGELWVSLGELRVSLGELLSFGWLKSIVSMGVRLSRRLISMFFFDLEIEWYYQYKENETVHTSADTRLGSMQDRSQMYSRISSSKTYVTEVTEKSSVWESSVAMSRPATSLVFDHSSSPEKHSILFWIECSCPNPRRQSACRILGTRKIFSPFLNSLWKTINDRSTIFSFSRQKNRSPMNSTKLYSPRCSSVGDPSTGMRMIRCFCLGVIAVIDDCDFLQLNSFLYRFLHWSSKRDPYSSILPNLFRYGEQEIFVNSSFRLILSSRRFDRRRESSFTWATRERESFFRMEEWSVCQSLCRSEYQSGSNHQWSLASSGSSEMSK